MIGYCDLDCSLCPAFIATVKNDDRLRLKTADEWNKRYKVSHPERPPLAPSDINCRGCLSNGPIYIYCRMCEVRNCGKKKGLKNCQECLQYKCEKLKSRQNSLY